MTVLLVRDLMRHPVITATPRTTLPQLNQILHEHHIRRVPIVDGDRLVGIVTRGDIRNAFPSDATTLSVYELSYLLSRVTAAEIMRTAVITIAADAPVVEAARLMVHHKISGLPVMDGRRMVGMISESDILQAVVAGTLPLAPPATTALSIAA
ncbi:CBS domain-containing protein [Kallotenue papyrolyticum]|uniref:CBS domain-containing protein n=1 Tax=Kallotenue papyrolyticum TaxID=1325125 RepID=UPI0004B33BFA|nr:CBS domain-containing protein [Kallotenue papyrolyticum]